MRSFISFFTRLSQRATRGARMNRFERHPQSAAEADVEYRDGDYRVRKPGAFVRCVVTGEPIALEDLRYWNVDLQEAYGSPEAKLARLKQKANE
jgi:hypothetical protein